MKKVANPLIYVIKSSRRHFIITTDNIGQLANRIVYFGYIDTKTKADRFVDKEMNDYPIYNIKKTKSNDDWPEASQWEKISKSKATSIIKLSQQIALNANYLAIEEARTLIRKMSGQELEKCKWEISTLLITLKEQLRNNELEPFLQQHIYLLIDELSSRTSIVHQ